jgi:hypothetical protein
MVSHKKQEHLNVGIPILLYILWAHLCLLD